MPSSADFVPVVCADLTATVANGQTASEEVDLGGCELLGIFVPSTFDGTQITLTAAPARGGTHLTVQDGDGSSSAFTVTTAAGRYVPLDNPAIAAGLRFVKLVCATSQTGDTVFTLATRPPR